MSRTTPTARSMAEARRLGYVCDVVERRLPRCPVTKDLYGAFDLLLIREGEPGALAVQVTSASNGAARWRKLMGNPLVRLWLACGLRAELWTWGLRGPRGGRKTWQLTRRELALADFKDLQEATS